MKMESVKKMDLPGVAVEFVYKDNVLEMVRLNQYEVTARNYQGITVYAPAAPKMVTRYRAAMVLGEQTFTVGLFENDWDAREAVQEIAEKNRLIEKVEVPEPEE